MQGRLPEGPFVPDAESAPFFSVKLVWRECVRSVFLVCVRACVRACVRVRARAWARACVRACVRAFVWIDGWMHSGGRQTGCDCVEGAQVG